MLSEKKFNLNEKIYIPKHILGHEGYEVKEYTVIEINEEQVHIKHTATINIPSFIREDGSGEIIKIPSDRFGYYKKSLDEKLIDTRWLIDFVCESVRREG